MVKRVYCIFIDVIAGHYVQISKPFHVETENDKHNEPGLSVNMSECLTLHQQSAPSDVVYFNKQNPSKDSMSIGKIS
jgi:hypothetical protein